jgi:hypothetical protein
MSIFTALYIVVEQYMAHLLVDIDIHLKSDNYNKPLVLQVLFVVAEVLIVPACFVVFVVLLLPDIG